MIKKYFSYLYLRHVNAGKNCKIQSLDVSYKAKIGENVVIRKGVKVGPECEIGDFSYISGPNSIVHSGVIGKFTSIALGVTIGLDEHNYKFITTHPFLYSKDFGGFVQRKHSIQTKSRPDIGNDVWIGANAIILKGVKVGSGSVIGAGSVVTKDIPPYAIVGGVPAKVIKYRFSQREISVLMDSKWWNWSRRKIVENISLFYSVDDFIDTTSSKNS